MSDETVHASETTRTRRGIATYLRRLADRLDRGEPLPADEEQTVTVSPPADPTFEVQVEREGDEVALELELAWTETGDDVERDVVASKARFELYEDKADEWRWRLVHRNGNIIADSSEGYASKQKARQGLDSVVRNAPGAYVVDTSTDETPDDEGGSSATFELFKDKGGKWRWRLVHDNGNVIADSGQGYASKQKARQGLRSVKGNVRGAPVETAE